ncbi:protein naked cuticle homolog 1-like [Penaeus chinensis]|uniref:protein naked cuticle homolog 1-like n=1 Tax=Penaeus chinensis TaxID=139456 RepID=UPI001FB6E0C4|nr:protein naked cuticle homolog 1-like [Penaeus chinensis]
MAAQTFSVYNRVSGSTEARLASKYLTFLIFQLLMVPQSEVMTQQMVYQISIANIAMEVSCDVSVAAGEAERQEFSFTLYDFDGGKCGVDIAGLVRTIYEAVGSSLSLPPSGSRTIRVKLTVAPEGRRGRGHPAPSPHSPPQPQQDAPGDTGKAEDGGDPCKAAPGRGHRRRKTRRRSTSLQRHELLQIIQANMEKNNLYYTPLHRRRDHLHHHDHHHSRRRRRHGCGCEHSGSPPDPAEVKARLLEPECPCRHTHFHNHTHGPSAAAPSTAGPCRRHNRSHSHDLSHDSPHVFRYHLLDKTFQPLPPSNTPDQPPSPPAPHHAHPGPPHHPHYHHPRHHHHHHRSRSFDAGDTHRSSPRGRSARSSRGQQQQASESPQLKQEQQPALSARLEHEGGGEVSPHHTKHRHREADHARAMAQVVAWLERGSLLDSPTSTASPDTGGSGGIGVGGGGACKEQLHHVHQHIHHHYHHYSEKQPPPLLI